jgi:hypothetical protein
VAGSGTGSVTGPGISCPGDCTETYTDGTQVTLQAAPSGSSIFGGWSGACSGSGSCQLTMDADKSAGATFNPPPADTTPPETTIAPSPLYTSDRTPTFSFSSSEPGSTFQCRVDNKYWYWCNSPYTLSKQSYAKHVFYVKARDAAGNWDPSPASRTFYVR